MHAFEHPDLNNFKCPICHTSADAPVYLIPIPWMEKDGISEAKQVHVECYDVVVKMHNTAGGEEYAQKG